MVSRTKDTNQNWERILKKLYRNLSLETESQNIFFKAFFKILTVIYKIQNS